jgi:hypothetical protein
MHEVDVYVREWVMNVWVSGLVSEKMSGPTIPLLT